MATYSIDSAHLAWDKSLIDPMKGWEEAPNDSASPTGMRNFPVDIQVTKQDIFTNYKLPHDMLPAQFVRDFPVYFQGWGTKQCAPNYQNTIITHAESKFGFRQKDLYKLRSPETIIGGVRKEAYDSCWENSKKPALIAGALSIATGIYLHMRPKVGAVFVDLPKWCGGPIGYSVGMAAFFYYMSLKPQDYEALYRRLEDAQAIDHAIDSRAETLKSQWVEHKANNQGWWSNA